MKAIELAAKYSLIPNRLKYCGPDDADKVFFDFIVTKKNGNKVKELLKDFKALSLYLELIARKNKKNTFDKNVVEAYWIGNSLLDNVSNKDIKNLILNDFTKEGLPKSVAQELAARTPEGITPHHSFHVLHVNFLTKKVNPTFANLDKCRISWGKVIDIMEKELLVEYAPIIAEKSKERGNKGKIKLGAAKTKKINYHKEFFDSIRKGDMISIHWNMAIEKLDQERLNNLKKYTLKNISIMNSV